MTSNNAPKQSQLNRAQRTRLLVAALLLPALTLLAALIALVVALPQLPETIAVQWSFDGTPQRFAAAWTNIAVTAAIGAFLTALIYGSARKAISSGRGGAPLRFLIGIGVGATGLVSALVTSSTLGQVGLDETEVQSHPLGTSFLLSLGFAIALGAIAAAITPKIEAGDSDAEDVQPMRLAPNERAVWTQHISGSPLIRWVVSISMVLALGAVVTTAILTPNAAIWIAVGVLAIAAALVTTTLSWRVTVSRRGLAARGALGWPMIRIPASAIETVAVTEVSALGEFGGYGIRFGRNRWGIITRDSAGIQVTRNDGKRTFVVTVDDADTGASLLQTYVRRS